MFINTLLKVLACLVFAQGVFASSHIELDAKDRQSLGLTVYNANFAVVTDRRKIVLPRGDVLLAFEDVARTIQPASVSLQSGQANGFRAAQQNYVFDLLNRQSLLERFVGRKLKYSRFLLEDGSFEKVLREGILLSINPEIVQFGDVIEIQPEGTISLPYLPEDLVTIPTLTFRGSNQHQGEQVLEVRYHAGNIVWEADYVLDIGRQDLLSGWVSIRNQSSTDFEVNNLRLVAGEINPGNSMPVPQVARMALEMAEDAAGPQREEVGDYHAYEFPAPAGGSITLPKNDLTQLRLIDSVVRTSKSYRLVSGVQRYGNEMAQQQSPAVWVEFVNDPQSGTGQPLPAGNVRVYEDDAFVGAARIRHTPEGQKVELQTGRAFDVTSDRKQTRFRRLGDRAAEVSYEVAFDNARDEAVTVIVEERLFGEWEILSESITGTRKDAASYVFNVRVPAKGSASVNYTARIRW